MNTISERAAAALENARVQAMRNGNMGQIHGYRLNHVVILAERIRLELRDHFAQIADEVGANAKEDRVRWTAEHIAARIRRDPMAVAPVPDLAGATLIAARHEEIRWLRRLLTWCLPRLKHPDYRSYLERRLAARPTPAPADEPPIVRSEAAEAKRDE